MRFYYLFKRELQSLFLSPIATAVGALFLFLNGLVLAYILHSASQGTTVPASAIYRGWLASGLTWIEIFLTVPVITMRLMSDEKRQGSLELLLTAPVSDLSIVLSKWAGALAFYLILWLPSVLVFFILRLYAPMDFRLFFSSLLVIALIGALWCAAGLLFSTLTPHMIIAALLTAAAFFTALIIGFISDLSAMNAISGGGKGPGEFFIGLSKQLNVFSTMDAFASGVVDSRTLVFYLSVTALLLLTTHQLLAARRYQG
jgi:ABC-2 type transport system permease protein